MKNNFVMSSYKGKETSNRNINRILENDRRKREKSNHNYNSDLSKSRKLKVIKYDLALDNKKLNFFKTLNSGFNTTKYSTMDNFKRDFKISKNKNPYYLNFFKQKNTVQDINIKKEIKEKINRYDNNKDNLYFTVLSKDVSKFEGKSQNIHFLSDFSSHLDILYKSVLMQREKSINLKNDIMCIKAFYKKYKLKMDLKLSELEKLYKKLDGVKSMIKSDYYLNLNIKVKHHKNIQQMNKINLKAEENIKNIKNSIDKIELTMFNTILFDLKVDNNYLKMENMNKHNLREEHQKLLKTYKNIF